MNPENNLLRALKTLFNVVDMDLAYFGILGCMFCYESKAVTSIRCLTMKFPVVRRVIVIKRDQEEAHECYTIAEKGKI